MASPNDSDKSKTKGKAKAAPAAEVLATSAVEVKVDAAENMSYKDYAAQRSEPVITVQQIIQRKGPPEPKKRDVWPNMEVKQEVMWGELPKEEPPKPDRQALTSRTHIIHAAPPRKPPPKGIGAMEPPGRK